MHRQGAGQRTTGWIDSTHMKANVSRASEELVELPESPVAYWERLDAYEEERLEELERRTGKRQKRRGKQLKKDRRHTRNRVRRTDPEAGHMKRPGKLIFVRLQAYHDRTNAVDISRKMTPVSVFFSARIPIADFVRPLCQQLHIGPNFSDKHSIYIVKWNKGNDAYSSKIADWITSPCSKLFNSNQSVEML